MYKVSLFVFFVELKVYVYLLFYVCHRVPIFVYMSLFIIWFVVMAYTFINLFISALLEACFLMIVTDEHSKQRHHRQSL